MSNLISPFLHEKKNFFVIYLDAKFYVHCNIQRNSFWEWKREQINTKIFFKNKKNLDLNYPADAGLNRALFPPFSNRALDNKSSFSLIC
jgi:hypothetical protein